MSAAVCYPGKLSLTSAARIMDEAKSRIVADGELTVDMAELLQCDSAAVCFMLELSRAAREKNCALRFVNIGDQLRALLKLYQVGKIFLPNEAANEAA
jgi:ABC-type transporter Mla MlaB component